MIVTTILVVLVVVLGYTTWNLLKKTEKIEDVATSQKELIDALTISVMKIDDVIKSLDSSGAFESDDEVGAFFEQIKVMRDTLIGNVTNQNGEENTNA
jgi:regulatory protein YycH of two-component signal transduction system YycFG